MTTIIKRSALVFHGHNPAPDVASVVVDHTGERRVVTWSDVMRNRRERQQRILRDKTTVRRLRAYRVYVEYFDQSLMGGWQAFIDRGDADHAWIDRDCRWLKEPLMKLFPILLFGDWHEWKVEFARRFTRGQRDGRPRGCAFVWWDGSGTATLRRAT
jgi:hypothetical protein